jgi:hypothetical protein
VAMRARGADPHVLLLERLPIADSLAAMMSHGDVWLLAPDERHARWIEREAAQPFRRNVRAERIAQDAAWADGVAARALAG